MAPKKTKTTKVNKAKTEVAETKAVKPAKAVKSPKNSKTKSKTKKDETPKEEDSSAETSDVQALVIKDTTIEKAVAALSKWNQEKQASGKKDLFEDDDSDIPLFLQVTSNKYLSTSKVLKPRMLEVPHPIHDLEDARVCIFVKDNLFDEESLARIEILKENKLKNLAQIVTVKDLKSKYHAYEARRKLLSEYDIFLTDASIANMIPKLLGKIFFGSSKLPLTITITENKELSVDKLVKNFNRALSSIGYILPMGINMGFKLGMLGQDIANLKENIHAIAKYLEKFPIRLIQLKLKESPSLPIYISKTVYSEEDVLTPEDAAKESKADLLDDIPVSIYAEGLKELGLDEDEANRLFGKKKRSADDSATGEESSVSEKAKKSKK